MKELQNKKKKKKIMDTPYYKVKETIKDTLNFFKNVWRFRKPLVNHYWWDNRASLEFLQVSLTHMSDSIEKYGIEIDESRLKKVNKMRRASELIRNYVEDSYIEMAESELGELILHDPEERAHNIKVFNRARKIEEQEWDELFSILKGQDLEKFDKNMEWEKQFDGSGLKGWWD